MNNKNKDTNSVKRVVCILNDREFEAFTKTKKREKKSAQFLVYMALYKSGYLS